MHKYSYFKFVSNIILNKWKIIMNSFNNYIEKGELDIYITLENEKKKSSKLEKLAFGYTEALVHAWAYAMHAVC